MKARIPKSAYGSNNSKSRDPADRKLSHIETKNKCDMFKIALPYL